MIRNDEKPICARQFVFRDTLRILLYVYIYLFIYLFILTQMCTKRLVKMCAKYWEILLTSF